MLACERKFKCGASLAGAAHHQAGQLTSLPPSHMASGCTHSIAANYDPSASLDDGSCILGS